MKRVSFLLFLFIVLASCRGQGELPVVSDEGIRFPQNGTVIKLKPNVVPVEREGEFGKILSMRQHAYLHEPWDTVFVFTVFFYNTSQASLLVEAYDYEGRFKSASKEYYGDFEVLYLDDRMVLAQLSQYSGSRESYLIDRGLRFIKAIPHAINVNHVFKSEDNQLFGLVSQFLRPLKEGEEPINPLFPVANPYNKVQIFTSEGILLEEVDTVESEIQVVFQGIRYTFEIPAPGIPG